MSQCLCQVLDLPQFAQLEHEHLLTEERCLEGLQTRLVHLQRSHTRESFLCTTEQDA